MILWWLLALPAVFAWSVVTVLGLMFVVSTRPRKGRQSRYNVRESG